MDKAEKLLKEFLRARGADRGVLSCCPTERDLWAYLEGRLSGSEEEGVGHHVAACGACLDALLLAQEVRPGIGFDPREGSQEEWVRKVKGFGKKKAPRAKGSFYKNRWLFLVLISLGLSFAIPRYFLQCLFLAALFGAKWVFDSMTNRTLIVLYEAWKKKKEEKEMEELGRRR